MTTEEKRVDEEESSPLDMPEPIPRVPRIRAHPLRGAAQHARFGRHAGRRWTPYRAGETHPQRVPSQGERAGPGAACGRLRPGRRHRFPHPARARQGARPPRAYGRRGVLRPPGAVRRDYRHYPRRGRGPRLEDLRQLQRQSSRAGAGHVPPDFAGRRGAGCLHVVSRGAFGR